MGGGRPSTFPAPDVMFNPPSNCNEILLMSLSLHHVKSLNVEVIHTLSTHLHVSSDDLSERKGTLLICFTN